jgi:hypothetical protein
LHNYEAERGATSERNGSRLLPVEDVEGDVGTRVADVAEVVGRDTADVHADLALLPQPEELLLFHQGVEQPRRVLLHSLGLRLCHGEDVEGRGVARRSRRRGVERTGADKERRPGRGLSTRAEEEKRQASWGRRRSKTHVQFFSNNFSIFEAQKPTVLIFVKLVWFINKIDR